MKKQFPNFLTCCNLLCGTLGIIYILDGYSWENLSGYAPAYFVFAACLFDFFDGFAARALNVSSPIGKELDSLADMVSFGVLPAVFMFKFIEHQSIGLSPELQRLLPYTALILAAFSALRLAIFNVDDSQKDSFRGLPTPANTLFITGLPFIPFDLHPFVLVLICVIFSFLMVSRIELFALKFKTFQWSTNKLRFTFLGVSILLLVIFSFAAIPLLILFYILLSLGEKATAG
jgi:CDP-diacylglycerol---serine O-phosphatidyltransferase